MVPLAALLLVGCFGGESGPDLAEVKGVVKMDGQPLADARVEFIPADGRPSSATTDAQGNFELHYTQTRKGALPGAHKVTVSTYRPANPDAEQPGAPERVPSKYNAATTLTQDVAAGKNEVTIEIDSKDGKIIQPDA